MVDLYKDLNQFTPTSRPYSTEAQAVYQSVVNIILTSVGERVFSPTFGIELEDYLFELSDSVNSNALLTELANRINEIDQRVEIDTNVSQITYNEADYSLRVNLIFNINGIDGQSFEIDEVVNL